ncbi:DJ-1/PfpI family protein [Methylobacterium planeticum]|uniref:DJ-1/PfpI family protein n=1 Tax=Methylobacterium planeticum TaxID=2615211 RepID=A0A6N6MRS9_9HYPH|nr:DJ-1/PfpI family protein [Methylobacterium planeticum]KAB1073166.1 DJ-1/PfpI family protein [Methylobacterium planeticum]
MTLEIGFLLFPDVQQLDLTGPYEVFASLPGTRLHLVTESLLAPVRASTGLLLTPTITYGDCPALDVICVPGGVGVNALLTDAPALTFLRDQAAGARFVTSVCTGALVLGAAGLLRGRRATTHWAAHDLLAAFGAIPVAERVVRDGNLVTGGGVTAGIDFALTLAAELVGPVEAQTVGLTLEYAPAPPFGSGRPEQASAAVLAAARARLAPSRRAREAILAEIAG